MFSAFAFSDSASQINAKIQRGLFLFAVSNSCVDPIVYGQSTTMASARNGAHTHILIQSVNPALCVVVKCRPNWKSKNVVVFSDMHSRADEYSYCHLSSQWFCFSSFEGMFSTVFRRSMKKRMERVRSCLSSASKVKTFLWSRQPGIEARGHSLTPGPKPGFIMTPEARQRTRSLKKDIDVI